MCRDMHVAQNDRNEDNNKANAFVECRETHILSHWNDQLNANRATNESHQRKRTKWRRQRRIHCFLSFIIELLLNFWMRNKPFRTWKTIKMHEKVQSGGQAEKIENEISQKGIAFDAATERKMRFTSNTRNHFERRIQSRQWRSRRRDEEDARN